MKIDAEKIRAFRLGTHHLHDRLPMQNMADAAGACGLQNTPPGAWETALYNRLSGCTLQALADALYTQKTLLQAWSFRGVPVVFPTGLSDVFLTPLIVQPGEEPWIYTLGISGALEHMQMPFDDVLLRVKQAAACLNECTIKSKETLDHTLAGIVHEGLPKEKQALWRAPSIYGDPQRQTMGEAAVSFMLRPCSFYSLVVFGQRQGASPTFTSCQNWLGHAPTPVAGAEGELVRRFLHCYGPATVEYFASWLGCSPRQARRLWHSAENEMEPVEVAGKTCYILSADKAALLSPQPAEDRLLLLGPHDPYLDLRDRAVILEDKTLQKTVWQYVSNPGVVLKAGRVIGVWKTKTQRDKLELSIRLFETLSATEQKTLHRLAEEYAAFRQLQLKGCTIACE